MGLDPEAARRNPARLPKMQEPLLEHATQESKDQTVMARTSTHLCGCGCGQYTNIVEHTERGYTKGDAYRFLRGHGSRGQTLTPEHRRAIGAGLKGVVFTDERRKRISAGLTGKKYGPRPLEYRQRLSKAHTGRKHPWAARPNSTNTRTTRWRARNMTDVAACRLAIIGGCQGPIDV